VHDFDYITNIHFGFYAMCLPCTAVM